MDEKTLASPCDVPGLVRSIAAALENREPMETVRARVIEAVDAMDGPSRSELMRALSERSSAGSRPRLRKRWVLLLLSVHARMGRWDELVHAYEADEAAFGSRANLRLALRAYEKLGRFERALAIARAALEEEADHLSPHVRVFRLLNTTSDFDGAHRAFEVMTAKFPPEDVINALAKTRGIRWNEAQIDFFLTHLGKNSPRILEVLGSLFGSSILGEEHLRRIELAVAALPDEERLGVMPFLTDARDQADLRLGQYVVLAYTRFVDRRNALARSYGGASLLHKLDSSVACSLPAAFRKRLGAGSMLTRETFDDALSLAKALRTSIGLGQPFAFARLGDGEGAFLRAYGYNDDATPTDTRERERICRHWWGHTIADERAAFFAEAFVKAMASFDIVGLPPQWRMAMKTGAGSQMLRNLSDAFRIQAQWGAPDAKLTSAHGNADLEKWGLWRHVLNPLDSVSVVSCHDIAGYLHDAFGLTVERFVAIPSHARYAELFGYDKDAPSMANAFEAICAEVEVRPGSVWLIAAGFLGKILAAQIKHAGGISIDIGSLADYWAGYHTRNYSGDEVEHMLPLSLVRGHGLDWRDRPAPSLLGGSRLVSTLGNEAFRPTPEKSAGPPPPELTLRVIGHPRCASGAITLAFRAAGFDVGHERFGADGTVNWMLTVEDGHGVWGEMPAPNQRFTHTLGFVRDPAEALPSIMLGNGVVRSFAFRRLHIHKKLGVDIASYGTPLARAVASLVYWYALVERLVDTPVIRIETVGDEIGERLASLGLRSRPEGSVGLLDSAVNSSLQKFGQAKPDVSASDYSALPNELWQQLEDFCARYRYPVPARS